MLHVLGCLLLFSPLLEAAGPPPAPASKSVIGGMAVIIRQHIQWNNWTAWSKAMAPFWAENFTYDFIYPFPKTHGLRDWYLGEHYHYNVAFPNFKSTNFLYLGTDDACSLQSYHTVYWTGEFAGVPAPPHKPKIYIKDMDFYTMENGRILYNWCMVDLIAILQQGGYQVLPPAPLPHGERYFPPRAMEGIPAPDDNYVDPSAAEKASVVLQSMIQEDLVAQSTKARWWAQDLSWCGPAGIGFAQSPDEYVTHFLKPLHAAFSDPRLQLDKFVCEGNYCGAHFHLIARHTGSWLGQPATGKQISLRFGIHGRVELGRSVPGCGMCGQITDGWFQLDIVEAFAQMGVDLLARARAQAAARTGTSEIAMAEAPEGELLQDTSIVQTAPRISPAMATGAMAPLVFVFVGWLLLKPPSMSRGEPLLQVQ